MKDSGFINILGWMVNRLKLSGNDLMVYAVIYGFSQDGESVYKGSGQYLADSIGISRRAVSDILDRLLEKEFILKIEKNIKGVKLCDYKVSTAFIPKDSEKPQNKGGIADSAIPMKSATQKGGMEDSAIPVKNLHREYGRICQGGIADSANHTSTDINKDTSSSEETPETNLKPSPNYEKAEAGLFSQKDLRDAVAKLDNALVLQNNSINDRLLLQKNFYKQAPAFMFKNNLSLDYLSWLCEKVKKQNYTSFKGLYYSLFFQEVTVEEYKSSLNFTKAPPPEIKIVCPVCGESHAESDDSCPSCRLPKDSKKETVLLFRELQKLPPEKRGEYLRREDEIANEFGFKDLTKSMEALAALKQEFGLSS